MKTIELSVDLARASKHPLRGDIRTSKVQQSRYERRKVREYLRAGDWPLEN